MHAACSGGVTMALRPFNMAHACLSAGPVHRLGGPQPGGDLT